MTGPTPVAGEPARREWTARRALRAVRQLSNPAFVRQRWRLRVVKTRYGAATLEDYFLDRRYGGSCSGTYRGRWDDLGYRGTSSAHYYALRRLFSPSNVSIGPEDVLVDVGSGKGRVLNAWLELGLANRLVGIEIDERWASFASQRLSGFANVEVLCGDVFDVLPDAGTIFYIFNPFTREVTERFKDRLATLGGPGHPVTLVYYMCNYADLFEADPAWKVTPVPDKTFHPAIVARLR